MASRNSAAVRPAGVCVGQEWPDEAAIMFSMENLDLDHRPYGVDTFDLMEAALYAETTSSSASSCSAACMAGFMDDCSDQVLLTFINLGSIKNVWAFKK